MARRKLKKRVIVKKKSAVIRKKDKSEFGDGQQWDRWNKKLLESIDRSIQAGRAYVESTYRKHFNEDAPTDKYSYRMIGLKIAYHLQELDCKAKGTYKDSNDKLLRRFKAAANFDRAGIGHLASMDSWGLDRQVVIRKGNPENLKPKTRSALRDQLEDLMRDLANGRKAITCGKGTKNQTIFKQGNRPHTVRAEGNKNPYTYDINKDWDRNAIYNRLYRWSKKEVLV